MYRHGDLLIVKVDSIPGSAKVKKDNILAYGTATGHSHRLSGGTVLEEGQSVYLKVPNSGVLTHEEHDDITLPLGDYRVIRQVEYNPYENATRMVMD
jgi:hypothetical protein